MSSRAARAEKREIRRQLEEANNRIRYLEGQVKMLASTEEYMTYEERGRNLMQDHWNQVG